jgi:hypothetical protein
MGIAMPIGRRRFRGGSYNITGHWKALSLKCFTAQWQSDAAYRPAFRT